ncbi:MAG: carboxypeptidase M32 [Desulfurococcales archaeon]|nr:carboxypeptidase M32 [Desulfurococcales archaeon]
MVFHDETVKEILDRYKTIWSIGHALGLLSWDNETYMPKGGVEERSTARAELSVLARRLLLDERFVELVERALGKEGLNDYERGVARVLHRQIRIQKSVPEKLVFELVKTAGEATHVWREARKRGDFQLFKPYLAKIVELRRSYAEHLGYEDHPYDALLDLYEEDLRVKDVDSIFERIVPETRRILEKVVAGELFPSRHELEEVVYEREAMEKVNREVVTILGYPWDRGRLDVSPHPFTITIGLKDVRITTRYEGRDFRRTLFATIHEFGHALYNLQVDERLKMTPLASGASLGIHESQSRFWENIVGRSPSFIDVVKPVLDKHLGFTKKYEKEELYRYFNIVRPDYIRVEADELTYNLHIYLRYELEKLMIAGELSVDDLPEQWDNLMEELLGIRPRNPSEGVLQDIHWSSGSIGYFPTYTIGNLVAAQIRHHVESKLGPLSDLIVERRFEDLRGFLRETIHKWGSTFKPKDLLLRQLGEPLNPEYLVNYLNEKYLRETG